MVTRAYKSLPQKERLKRMVTTRPRQVSKGNKIISKNHMKKAKRIAELAGAPAPVFTQPGRCKKDKYIHPKGRLARQLRRKAHKSLAKEARSEDRFSKLEKRAEMFLWFANQLRGHLDQEYVCTSDSYIADWVFRYIQRNDEQLERYARRRGNDPKVRGPERALAQERAEEFYQYEVGMEIPDITQKSVCDFLRTWDGNGDEIRKIPLKRVKSPLGKKRPKPRVFPPMHPRSRRARRLASEAFMAERKALRRKRWEERHQGVKQFDAPGTQAQMAKSTEQRKRATLGARADRRAGILAKRRKEMTTETVTPMPDPSFAPSKNERSSGHRDRVRGKRDRRNRREQS